MRTYTAKNKIRWMALTGMFAALTCILTWFPQIPIPASNGYLHFGDALIYLGASILPAPYAALAGALGGGLADLLSGYAIWALPTMLIKAAISLPLTSKASKLLCRRNIGMLFVCALITVTGYFAAGWLLSGNVGTAAAGLPSNLIQASGSALIYLVIAGMFDKTGIKKNMMQS